jgi:mitochondrial inner membrane protease ATP23
MSTTPSPTPSSHGPGSTSWRRCMRFVDYAQKHCRFPAHLLSVLHPPSRFCLRPPHDPRLAPLHSAAPRLQSLLRKIDAKGCRLASPPVVCEDIFGGAPLLGAYDSDRKLIIMNPALGEKWMTQSEWTRTITHELIHAFDNCRVDLDPTNCRHIACTEVRAGNLSGDCDFTVDLMRGGLQSADIAGHQRRCVRRRAELSLSAHAHCAAHPHGGVRGVVDSVFDACYQDTEPFSSN